MINVRRIFLGLAVSAIVIVAGEAFAATYGYTPFDYLGALNTYANGINAAGQIVGNYQNSDLILHAYLKDGVTYTPFNYPGASRTGFGGINAAGQIVGSCSLGGFIKDGTTYTFLDPPYTNPNGINDSGLIVGDYSDATALHGFLKDGDTYTTLDFPGVTLLACSASGINAAGQIVGSYQLTDGTWHGFLKDGTTYTTINYPGAGSTIPTGINAAGQIVGYYVSGGIYGFLKDGDTYTTLDFPGAFYSWAKDINDSGQIVGEYEDTSFIFHGFVASEIPLPPSVLLLGSGLLGLAGLRRFRKG